jgi:hypothetical protein
MKPHANAATYPKPGWRSERLGFCAPALAPNENGESGSRPGRRLLSPAGVALQTTVASRRSR